MPSEPAERVHDLEDFVTFLDGTLADGFEFVVIGGCAVGAYGRLKGRELLTVDLDILTTYPTLWEILDWASARGAVIRKRPVARNIPVAFLEWEGREVNILASAIGLPAPEDALRLGRVVRLSKHDNLGVPLADPFDLLNAKLQVNRPKDQPHIEFLREFVEEEIVDDFTREQEPRRRLSGARRLLTILGVKKLPEGLARRLAPLAQTPADFRFLVNTSPDPEAVLEAARERAPELVEDLLALRQRREVG